MCDVSACVLLQCPAFNAWPVWPLLLHQWSDDSVIESPYYNYVALTCISMGSSMQLWLRRPGVNALLLHRPTSPNIIITWHLKCHDLILTAATIESTQSLLIQAGVCAATMEALFEQGGDEPDFNYCFLSQYWAVMAGHLTTLKLVIGTAFTEHTSMALNPLTRLTCLVLAAADQDPIARSYVDGYIELSMPLLQRLDSWI